MSASGLSGPLVFYQSSAYFTEVKWSISKKSIIFQGSRGGPTFCRGGGGSNFFQGIRINVFCSRTVTPVRLELAALQSRVKQSTTEPLRSEEIVS